MNNSFIRITLAVAGEPINFFDCKSENLEALRTLYETMMEGIEEGLLDAINSS